MKKFVKRMTCIALSVAMASVSMASCTSKDDDSKSAEDKTYKIGICQLVQHEALDAATEGFKEALKEKLGDKVTFDEQNASGEATNCTTICSKFVSDKVDLILANATGALTAAAQATADIPIVATSITDYATALDIKDWTGKTGFNVTGTSDLAPLADQAKMIKELVPDAKKVGIIYCSAENNSKYQATEITKSLTELGLEATEYTFVDTNDVTAVTKQAASECDVIFAPTDNTVASNGPAINNVLEPAKIPLIAGEEGICQKCGIATLSISYHDIGYKAGEMAYEILVNGKDPGDMEIEYAKDLTKKYMPERCKELGITVSEDYTAIEAE
ncbi:MAG: ABC transporter substrate binding protein [Oscillospiraceae bacterium]